MTETKTDNVSIVINQKKGLTAKVVEVLAIIDRIEKRGFNENQHYKFATEADVSDTIRKELASRNVFIWSTVKDNISTRPSISGKQEITRVWIDYTFEDAETKETKIVSWPGEGADGGDKGLYKAFTGSLKYMLLKNFLMSSGDDPENTVKDEPTRPPIQRGRPPIAQSKSQVNRFAAQTGVPKAEIPVSVQTYVATDDDLPTVLQTDKEITGPVFPKETRTPFEEVFPTKPEFNAYIKESKGYIEQLKGIIDNPSDILRSYFLRETGKGDTKNLNRKEWESILTPLRAANSKESLAAILTGKGATA